MKTNIFKQLNKSQINKILKVLSRWGEEGGGDYYGTWYRYSELAVQTRVSIKKLKPLMKFFKELKIVEYTYLLSDYNELCGTGYILVEKFRDLTWEQIKEKRVQKRV